MWPVTCPLFFFVARWSYIFIHDLDDSLFYIYPNTCLLPFLFSCVVPWEVPTYFLNCIYYNAYFGGIFILLPQFNPFPNRHLCLFICLVTLNLAHIQHTPWFNITSIRVVTAIHSIMYIVRIVSRHGRRWSLYMIIFIMHIMTLRHYHRLPSRSHYWYSSSLISVIMVGSALLKVLPQYFPPSSWVFSLLYCIYLFWTSHNLLACG